MTFKDKARGRIKTEIHKGLTGCIHGGEHRPSHLLTAATPPLVNRDEVCSGAIIEDHGGDLPLD